MANCLSMAIHTSANSYWHPTIATWAQRLARSVSEMIAVAVTVTGASLDAIRYSDERFVMHCEWSFSAHCHESCRLIRI